LWRKARRENSAASRLLGSTSLRFALHGWQRMSTVVDLLYRIVTFKSGQCPRVEVNANIVQCWGLTLHDCPAAQVGLNIGVVWRHQGDDGLTQSGGRLRSKITAHGC
ncbi:hypothetical protein, partial [Thiolapillus sp.]|uniref:hypothetical protein n=1 Tax=Thiolapillus sp. TaxID=2017437 RepID=UPI003AF9C992